LGWWKRGAIKGTINANDVLTFYVKNGDYIGKSAAFFSLLIVLIFGANVVMKRPALKN
jgi:apolipoprotein N-acyltransferase